MTVKFDGHVSDVIDRLVEKGIVATKTEALRLGVLRLEAEYLKEAELERRFDDWAVKEVERLDTLRKTGASKVYTQKEFEEMIAAHDRNRTVVQCTAQLVDKPRTGGSAHRHGGQLRNKKR